MSDVGAVEEIEAQNTIAAVIVHDLNKGGDGFTVDNRETELQVTGTVWQRHSPRLWAGIAPILLSRPDGGIVMTCLDTTTHSRSASMSATACKGSTVRKLTLTRTVATSSCSMK